MKYYHCLFTPMMKNAIPGNQLCHQAPQKLPDHGTLDRVVRWSLRQEVDTAL